MINKKQASFDKLKKHKVLILFLFIFQFSLANSSTISAHSEYFTLSGKVLDENKKPIQGVSVKSYEFSQEATTDENGSFSIDSVVIDDKLMFKLRDYDFQIIKIKSRDELLVILKPTTPSTQDQIFTAVEVQATFPGGMDGLMKYLSENVKYPKVARKKGIQGKVFASFVIGSDGNITDIKILKGIGGGCDEETIRVIKGMPKWTPGKQSGRFINTRFTLPISFTLSR